jgi:anti-sigma regulatory factor (Ser/Thr protein kinase)
MPTSLQRSGGPADAFVSRFVAQAHAVSACRQAFVGWMRGAEVDSEAVDDLEVVFSELAANAVTASPDASDDVRVHAQLDDGVLVLEVSNRTARDDHVPVSVPDLDDTLREQGRGLLIARAFVDSVRMETQLPDRFVVRCNRRLHLGC